MSDLYEDDLPEVNDRKDLPNEEAVADNKPETNEQEKPTKITYSWVSPKLQEQKAEEEEPDSANPWGSTGANVWRTETSSTGKKTEENPKPTYRVNSEKTDRKKKKKPAGPGKKWATTVAMAVVFGLVAGLVFTGVTAAGRQLTAPKETEKIQLAAPELETKENSDVMELPAENPSVRSGGTVADVAAQCMPSLVTISTISVEEMRSFFGQTQQYEVEGAGTGVIVGQNDTELLIATNNHVVSGAKSLSVGFIDETAVAGAVKGYDASTDLAVVAVELESISAETMNQIRVCEMGNSDELVLGEQVVAIGNALGIGQSVTSGYISAFNRELDLSDGTYTFTSSNLIQTDASINSGNSGGALLNMRGQLIGINEAKRSGNSSSASVDNIGFAIPISKAEPILENLMTLTTRDKVDDEHKAYIGITCADVNQEAASMYNIPTGVCLTGIMEGSPADQAGLKKGDILTSFDGRQVATYDELINLLQYYAAGETVDVVVQRSDEGEYSERTVSITLGAAENMPQEYQSEDSQGQGGIRP